MTAVFKDAENLNRVALGRHAALKFRDLWVIDRLFKERLSLADNLHIFPELLKLWTQNRR